MIRMTVALGAACLVLLGSGSDGSAASLATEDEQTLPAMRNLLKDPSPAVRLRAALALAKTGEAEAVPVLIDLLAELDTEQRRPVEEVLRELAGEWAPVLEFAREDEISRRIRRDAWASWWRHTDGALLLQTLGKHTLTADKRERVRGLIARLGSEEFAVRESAARELAALGRVALPQLREGAKDRDAEVTRRSSLLIERIEGDPSQPLPVAVLRLLAVRKPAGAAEALLAYLPNAEEEERTEEVRQALGQLSLRDGRADPVLLRGLSDARPPLRIAAAEALIAGGGTESRIAARKLLADEALLVRRQVALALARAGEREAVAVLIDLLAALPAEQREQVEASLYTLAGDRAPDMPGGDKPEERKKCRDAWAAWWKTNGDHIDLARLADQPRLGFTLVCDANQGNRVFEIDPHGKERWAIENAGTPVEAVVLPGKRVLIAEHRANRVTERDFQGKVLWEKRVAASPCNVQRLGNGNTFIAVLGGSILEVDRAGKEVYTIPKVPGGVQAAQRSRRGDIVCLTQNGQCLLLDAAGKQLGSFAIGYNLNSAGCMDLPANGHVLIACHTHNKVLEFDRAGKKLREWDAPGVCTATALPNGRILVGDDQGRVYEMDRAGKIVWEQKTPGRPFRARRR
jgi:HEAT repeat protein